MKKKKKIDQLISYRSAKASKPKITLAHVLIFNTNKSGSFGFFFNIKPFLPCHFLFNIGGAYHTQVHNIHET